MIKEPLFARYEHLDSQGTLYTEVPSDKKPKSITELAKYHDDELFEFIK